MAARPIRVLIVDDHALFRAGLRKLLEAEPGFHVVGEAESGIGASGLVRQLDPDVVLLDLALPGMSGMDVLRELVSLRTNAKVVVLTASISDAGIVEALEIGAVGVLLKTVAIELLYKCLRSVVANQYWVGRDAVGSLVALLAAVRAAAASPQRPFGLTPRELEVARLVSQGFSNREIARKLSISEDTVKHHLTSAFDKTGASSRVELALFMTHHQGSTDRGAPTPER